MVLSAELSSKGKAKQDCARKTAVKIRTGIVGWRHLKIIPIGGSTPVHRKQFLSKRYAVEANVDKYDAFSEIANIAN